MPDRDETAHPGWLGKSIFDPDGLELGTVHGLAPDGVGEWWVTMEAHWGVLDLFHNDRLAPSDRRFRFHSSDFEETGDGLVLRRSAVRRDVA